MAHITIPRSETDGDVYPTDTPDEIATARSALYAAGYVSAPVFVGEPGEAHRNGRLLFASDEVDPGAIVVVGRGPCDVRAIRSAANLPENWRLAMDRGDVEVGHEPDGEEWCVVLPGDFDAALLDTAQGVACYGHVPADSSALARWRAA